MAFEAIDYFSGDFREIFKDSNAGTICPILFSGMGPAVFLQFYNT
jgi:hypothetical protein